jgi:predicted type IV restriction endonuclease
MTTFNDWGEISETFETIKKNAFNRNLQLESEAQTRFDIIDRIIREVLQWKFGQIQVEEHLEDTGYVDYILESSDFKIIIEAKKIGAAFPSPTKKKKLKLTGEILGSGEISKALQQAENYAIKSKGHVIVATNGSCWVFYPIMGFYKKEDIYATILFPLEKPEDAEELFNILGSQNVENNSLLEITTETPFAQERKIINVLRDKDARIDRNNIADFIAPALDNALYSETLFSDPEKLEKCFVSTEARTKFDSQLQIYLQDAKPELVSPARRIKKNKDIDELGDFVISSAPSITPPVTLIIGTVGSGKSTYLKHFELIKAKKILEDNKCHWIYIDFEEMGITGNPREFMYRKLKDYLLLEHPNNPTDYKSAVEPAYEEDIKALARGPFAGIFVSNKEKFKEKVNDLIISEFEKIEPYVDKVLRYLASKNLCVIILDNIDLYENSELETIVFSEGVALSKKIKSNIIVSIRDSTYIKHRADSIFNAYELKKLWLDPPPFKDVLSKRLNYSKEILKNKSAIIPLSSNMKLNVPDLSIFFEIVKTSLLNEINGKFLESISDRNPRRGILLTRNFLTSGHIQADKAIKNYISEDAKFKFPYQEVFKGSMLGQWKYFKETRSECYNIFDSYFNSYNQQLLRLFILKYLFYNAQDKNSSETPILEIVTLFSKVGVSENRIINVLQSMIKSELIRSKEGDEITLDKTLFITLCGGYYVSVLAKNFTYIEVVMHDTNIHNNTIWEQLDILSQTIEQTASIIERMELRQERVLLFIDYLSDIENIYQDKIGKYPFLKHMEEIKKLVIIQTNKAIRNSRKFYSE